MTRLYTLSLALVLLATGTGCSNSDAISESLSPSSRAETAPTASSPSVPDNPSSATQPATDDTTVRASIGLQDLAALPVRFSAYQAPGTAPNNLASRLPGGAPPPRPQAPPPAAKNSPQPSASPQPTAKKAPQKVSTAPAFRSTPYQVLNESKEPAFKVRGQQVFSDGRLPQVKLDVKAADLLAVVQSTRQYFQDAGQRDANLFHGGILGTKGVTRTDIIRTLDFMIQVLKEDISQGRASRLQDPKFINQHFRVLKWQPFNPKKPEQRQVRITKYAVFSHRGSLTKTATHNVPLYYLPPEARKQSFVKQYTKQKVLSGVFEPGGEAAGWAQPLVYLTREGLEDALLEGTVLVQLPDGRQVYYNVATSNGIPFVHGVPQRQQKRYWYFRPVQGIHGYGPISNAKVDIKPGVTFAGDVINIGLGRIIAMEYGQGANKQIKLGVLADTGGAFLPNLHQLDYLSGIFPNKTAFKQHIRQLPTYAQPYILVKKKG